MGGSRVGALWSGNGYGFFSGISVSGSVKGVYRVGGLAGYDPVHTANFLNVTNYADVRGFEDVCGIGNGDIKFARNYGSVTGKLVLVVVVYGVRFYLLLFYRPKMTFLGESVKSTKLKQPMVIIANHTSMLDPLMVQALFFHKRSIVVAKDQVEDPHFSWALTRIKIAWQIFFAWAEPRDPPLTVKSWEAT